MIGRTFTVIEKYKAKFPFDLDQGMVSAVVRRFGSQDSDHFKFYDLCQYPQGPPAMGSQDWLYHPCRYMMSTNSKKTGFKWDVVNTKKNQKSRERKRTFEWTYSKPNGLYDRRSDDESIQKSKYNILYINIFVL